MNYDVVIVGAGPAGLASAIHIKQLSKIQNTELSVAVIEKGSSVGANIISGCVMDPSALNELIPEWPNLNFPVTTKVTHDVLKFLTSKKSIRLPHLKRWGNSGNYIISLSQLCTKLADYAESLGVEIYAGVAVKDIIIENNVVTGVITGDSGILKDGTFGPNYQSGFEIYAKQIILAEGARGSLTKSVIKRFNLDQNAEPQTYGLGIKEIWQVETAKHKAGTVCHYVGYPLNNNAYGGGFLYHLNDNLVSVGLVTALDYKNTYLNPYQEFQKFKLHPEIKNVLDGAKRLEYGARTIVEGGVQALIKPTFPGGIIIGDSLGLVNVPKIKGVNYAIKSGIIAAEATLIGLKKNESESSEYKNMLYNSYVYKDLYQVRNFRPAFKHGLLIGLCHGLLDYISKGDLPYTLKNCGGDNKTTNTYDKCAEITYAKPDNLLTFDRQSSLVLSNISCDDSQISHLKLTNNNVPITVNLELFDSPEVRYCPAGVYEILVDVNNQKYLQVNSANCLHCKACDIKDPTGNITWTVPEGGSGPQYSLM